MKLHELHAIPGANKAVTRKGRGIGSGNGKTAGFGSKGQKARSGVKHAGFEGGQMPLYRRLPKRGFTNYNHKDIVAVSLSVIADKFDDGASVDAQKLMDAGIIDHFGDGIKILSGDKGKDKLNLTKKLTIEANAFSAAAKSKIEAAGGEAKVIEK